MHCGYEDKKVKIDGIKVGTYFFSCSFFFVGELFFPSSDWMQTADPFDDTIETPEMEDKGTRVSWREVGRVLAACLSGSGEYLCRTENLLHTLGSVTSFCCTDKKGNK